MKITPLHMETNPHTLLTFGPKTRGGHEVIMITQGELQYFGQCLYASLLINGSINHYFISSDGQKFLEFKVYSDPRDAGWEQEDNDFIALIPTNTPPYAPQPYTQWEDVRKLERYEKALQFYANRENWFAIDMCCETKEPRTSGSPCGLCDDYYQYNPVLGDEMGSVAREALKGGGYE